MNVFFTTSPGLEGTLLHEIARKPYLGLIDPQADIGGIEYRWPHFDWNLLALACFTLQTPACPLTFLIHHMVDDILLRIARLPLDNQLEIFSQELSKIDFSFFVPPSRAELRISVAPNVHSAPPSSLIVRKFTHHLSQYYGIQFSSQDTINKKSSPHHGRNLDPTGDSGEATSPIGSIHRPIIALRIEKDFLLVSLFAAKDMYKRNAPNHPKWISDAPLRETAAASIWEIIRQSNECQYLRFNSMDTPIKSNNKKISDPQSPPHSCLVWDPFCGGGTLILELIKSFLSSCNHESRFGFLQFPGLTPSQRSSILQGHQIWRNKMRYPGLSHLQLTASDWSSRAIEATDANKKALLDHHGHQLDQLDFKIKLGDFEKIASTMPQSSDPQHNITIVTNIPYGDRIPVQSSIFQRLGRLLGRRRDFKQVYILNGSNHFERDTKRKWKKLIQFSNRGIPVSLLKLVR